uniref:endo-1,4-beta-xylanase n=2 Tax=termite gut metagenome TaxID=433724 RepID=S0DFK9_9ZZZZ
MNFKPINTMNLKNIIRLLTVALVLVGLNSCYSEKMKWDDPYTHIPTGDLPIELQEKIAMYEAINAYATFKIGVAVDFGLYMTDEEYRAIVDENFDEVVPGNEMKQQSLMNAQGVLNFDRNDPTIEELLAAGLDIYGHTLVWYQQAQASYFNSLIAPTIVPGTPGSSLVDGSFEEGMGGWTPAFNAQNYTVVDTEAVDGTQSLQVVVSGSTGKYDAQLNSPAFPIVAGHHYQLSFWIKGSVPGKVGIDFPNAELGNQYPWVNGAELADVGTSWTQVIYNTETVGDPAMIATADNGAMTVRLLLGGVAECTYLIDAVEITDLDDAPVDTNLISDGNFEGGAMGDWVAPYYSDEYTVVDTESFDGTHSLQVAVGSGAAGKYDRQLNSPAFPIITGHHYQISFWIKSNGDGKVGLDFPSNELGNQYPWGSGGELATVGTSWTQVTYNTTVSGDPAMIATADNAAMTFRLLLGAVADCTYWIDAVEVTDLDTANAGARVAPRMMTRASGPITIEKTPEEKKEIIGAAFVKYITDVATHYKGKVTAWDVLNEPMNENGTLRVGTEDLSATSVFHWAYYLGEDYAVTAFKTAREADPDAKLFINDYGLESTGGAKLDGLIGYVNHIEANGGQVDGIGTQMHLNLNWVDRDAITAMFTKLAATGKLIKVTELDIAISTESSAGGGPATPLSPAAAELEAQADLYGFVAKTYSEIIPPAQQYGITLWGVSDNPEQHLYWLPNDAPCLWDADYQRKWAYKGFCDGLYGSDVSADWTYDDLVNDAAK